MQNLPRFYFALAAAGKALAALDRGLAAIDKRITRHTANRTDNRNRS